MHATPHPLSSIRRRRIISVAIMGGATLMLILVIMLLISFETGSRFRKINAGWQQYSRAADPQGVWISEIRGYFGYGGLIHNFKNYVLRQDEKYKNTLHNQRRLLLRTIGKYQQSDPDEVEAQALAQIKKVVLEYSRNIDIITLNIAQNKTAEQIDALVKVDDSGALTALVVLEQHWRQKRQKNLDDLVSALSAGEALVRSLASVMLLLTALVGVIAVLIFALMNNVLRSSTAQLKELKARKVAQDEERKLAWVVQQSPASILITDTKGTIEFVNRKMLEMTGYSEDEMIGKSPGLLKSGHTAATAYEDIWENLSKGIPWNGVFKNLRKDGSHYWASTSLLPLLNEEGEITNFIGVGEDITEKRHVDEQIAQVQKMEAVGVLAGSIAHDFNNVLMTIIGNTELIKMEADDIDAPDELMVSLGHIEIASRRARALIQQLLTFARQQPGRPRRLNLFMAITEALELIRVSTPPSVRIDFEADAKDIATEIDPTAFFQIVMNLCHNAVEAIGDQSGSIKLLLSRVEMGQKTALEKLPEGAVGTVRLEICDNGPGISPEIQQRIFEPFFSTKPVGKGTGLGLAIVQNWVGESDGRVTLQSDLGQGSCFTLLFPEYPDTTETAEQPVRPPTGSEHILLVDDEEQLLYTIRRMMARLGYQVEAFSNPSLALHAFKGNPDRYDAIVTDMMMPCINGAELIESLREIRPDLPAMLISSYIDDSTRLQEIGNVVKVAKPINMTALAYAMRSVFEK